MLELVSEAVGGPPLLVDVEDDDVGVRHFIAKLDNLEISNCIGDDSSVLMIVREPC